MRTTMIHFNWFEKSLLKIVVGVISMCVSFGFFVELLSNTLNYFIIGNDFQTNWSNTIINGIAYSLVLIAWNGIYFTYLFFQKSKNQEVQTIHLEASKNEMQLKTLRNQLNPHFLFNALNSIRALIDLEPKTAKVAITELSNLLRKSLVLGDKIFIHLEQELEIVHHYLELEKMRFEERLNYQIVVSDNSLFTENIPPFLIQNLVENAIKHGLSQSIDGGTILINIDKMDGEILIEITNPGHLKTDKDTGIGIENTRTRLQLLYNNSASFTLIEKEGKVIATLRF